MQTLPRLKSDLGFNLDFCINLDPDPEICQIAAKMYRIHSLVGKSHLAECPKNRAVIDCMRNANKSPKIRYSTMVRETEK